MVEPQVKRAKLANAVPANEVITFHMLKNTPEGPAIEENGVFPPEMTHQLFGEEEEVRGYDGLSIDIFITPRLQPLVDVKFADKGPGATDLKTPFAEVFAAGMFEKKADFDAALRAEAPLPLGTLGRQVASAESEEGSQFLVTAANLSTASPELKELHARAQAFLYFFVDAASAIDQEDPEWDIYLALEQSQDGLELMGFATVYRFFAYPDRCRLRLSQIMVLPPHQGRGAGSLLLKAIAQQAEEINAVDVTFEDPSEGLQRIRDRLDLQRALRCAWLQEAAMHSVSTAAACTAPPGEDEALAAEMALSAEDAVRAQKELRISKQQVRRVWECMLLLLGSAVPQSEKVAAAVEAMILRRMQGQVAAAKKDATGKAMRETESGFVMARQRRPAGAAGGSGGPAPAPVPGAAVEGVTPEQQEEAIEQAVESRMEELQAVVASMTGANGSGAGKKG